MDIQYLVKHPSALNLCHLVIDSGSQGLTASEASRILGLAIQTITNSLRDLERKKILKSTKHGVQRRYWAVDDNRLSLAVDEAFSVIAESRIRGKVIPLRILLKNIGEELQSSLSLKKNNELELAEDVSLDSLPSSVKLEFQLRKRDRALFSIMISLIDSEADMIAAWAKVLLVTEIKNIGSLILILIINYNLMTERLQQDFGIIESKLKQITDPKVMMESYHTSHAVIMQRGFAKEEIVPRILDHISKLS